jgi:hypothetical protein
MFTRSLASFTSKNEVLRYMDEGELPESVNGDCDTSTKDNRKESDAHSLRGEGGELGFLKPYPMASLLLHKVN